VSTPVCKAHPTSRVLLVQYMEGNLSFVCRTCGLDLPEEAPEPAVPETSEVRIKGAEELDYAAEE
jgi:hypothetical protein